MNRRGFLKGAVTVGLVASIIKGRHVEIQGYNELGRPLHMGVDLASGEDHTAYFFVGNEDGASKMYYDQRAFLETTPNGVRFNYSQFMDPKKW